MNRCRPDKWRRAAALILAVNMLNFKMLPSSSNFAFANESFTPVLEINESTVPTVPVSNDPSVTNSSIAKENNNNLLQQDVDFMMGGGSSISPPTSSPTSQVSQIDRTPIDVKDKKKLPPKVRDYVEELEQRLGNNFGITVSRLTYKCGGEVNCNNDLYRIQVVYLAADLRLGDGQFRSVDIVVNRKGNIQGIGEVAFDGISEVDGQMLHNGLKQTTEDPVYLMTQITVNAVDPDKSIHIAVTTTSGIKYYKVYRDNNNNEILQDETRLVLVMPTLKTFYGLSDVPTNIRAEINPKNSNEINVFISETQNGAVVDVGKIVIMTYAGQYNIKQVVDLKTHTQAQFGYEAGYKLSYIWRTTCADINCMGGYWRSQISGIVTDPVTGTNTASIVSIAYGPLAPPLWSDAATVHFASIADLLKQATDMDMPAAVVSTLSSVKSAIKNLTFNFTYSPNSVPPGYKVVLTNAGAVIGGLSRMEFVVARDGSISAENLRVTFKNAAGDLKPDGQLLFAAMKLLEPNATDVRALGLLTQINVLASNQDLSIHFKFGGKYYTVYPNGMLMSVLELTKQEMLDYVSSQPEGRVRTSALGMVQAVPENGGFYKYTFVFTNGTTFVYYECSNVKLNLDKPTNAHPIVFPGDAVSNPYNWIFIYDTAKALLYKARQFFFAENSSSIIMVDYRNMSSTLPVEWVKTQNLLKRTPYADVHYDPYGNITNTTYYQYNWGSLPLLETLPANTVIFPSKFRHYDAQNNLLREFSMAADGSIASMTGYGIMPVTQSPVKVEVYTKNQNLYSTLDYDSQGRLVSYTWLPTYVSQLKSALPGFTVSPAVYVSGSDPPSFQISVTNPSPVGGALQRMVINLDADAQIDINMFDAFYEGVSLPSFDKKLLFWRMKDLEPGATDIQALALMSQITTDHVDADGMIYFVWNGSTFVADPTLFTVIQTYLDDDDLINRAEMLSLFNQIGADNVVSAVDFYTLEMIQKNPDLYPQPDYVHNLADAVVLGTLSNATYQGESLGNLAASSSGSHLEKLVNKWFLGLDNPILTTDFWGFPLHYEQAVGQLLIDGSNYTDIREGSALNCSLMASLAALAFRVPDLIGSMIIDNGDGTFTVRFFRNGVPDYVTVDGQLPVYSSGDLAFAGYGAKASDSNVELWTALVEKAYVQINAKWGDPDAFYPISNPNDYFVFMRPGWAGPPLSALTGVAYSSASPKYGKFSTFESVLSLWNAGALLILGSKESPAKTNVHPSHAYTVVDYDSATQMFSLFNPWGIGYGLLTLTWNQIQDSFGVMEWVTV